MKTYYDVVRKIDGRVEATYDVTKSTDKARDRLEKNLLDSISNDCYLRLSIRASAFEVKDSAQEPT